MKTLSLLLAILSGGCAGESWRTRAPHNFPPAHEWNAGLETSWINAVDTYRRLTAPRGKIYDPVMRTYQPDLGRLLKSPESVTIQPPNPQDLPKSTENQPKA
jgi:hypothetical protein